MYNEMLKMEIAEFLKMAEKFGVVLGNDDEVSVGNFRVITELMRRIMDLEDRMNNE